MKTIKLTKGQVALVDDADYEWLSQWRWGARKYPNTYYAVRTEYLSIGKRKLIFMHKAILDIIDSPIMVDHKNHRGLDNQRHNLREASRIDNSRNCNIHLDNTTGYKGIVLDKIKHKYRTRLGIARKKLHLGYFNCPIQAAKMYDFWARDIYGEFANCNFKGKRVGIRKIVIDEENESDV